MTAVQDRHAGRTPLYERRLSHYDYIDALRAVAFLCVFCLHVHFKLRPFPFQEYFIFGKYGVQLFFVISAVTLFRSFAIRSGKETFPVRNFFVRRFFRIAPLFYTGIIFYAVTIGHSYSEWRPAGLHAWQIVTSFLFVHGWTPESIEAVVPGGWSIAVEMTFYLCLPVIFKYVRNATIALTSAAGAVLLAIGLNAVAVHFLRPITAPLNQPLIPEFVYFWFPSQLPVFLIGAAVYHLLHKSSCTEFLRLAALPLLAIGIVFWAWCVWMLLPMWIFPQVFFSVAFALIVMGLAAHPVRLVVNAALTNLGKISFSCYVTHFGALAISWRAISFLQQHSPLLQSFSVRFASYAVLALGLTILASIISYNVIERPGIAAGNWLIGQWENRDKPRRVERPLSSQMA